MRIEFDRSTGISNERRLQTLAESVQRAFDSIEDQVGEGISYVEVNSGEIPPLPMIQGGTGANLSKAPSNSIFAKGTDGDYMSCIPVTYGVFYSADGIKAKFGTLPMELGGTGAKTAGEARNNVNFIGRNILSGPAEDTPEFWVSKGTGVAHIYENPDLITDQPSDTGILLNLINTGGSVRQMWFKMTSGEVYHRGGNKEKGWEGTWVNFYDSNSTIPVKNGGTGQSSIEMARQNINYMGSNVIGNKDNDMPVTWAGFKTGYSYASVTNLLKEQPASYGFIENIVTNGASVFQKFLANGGGIWHRTGNATTDQWDNNGKWTRVIDAKNMRRGSVTITPSAANTPTVKAVTWDVMDGTPTVSATAITSVPGTQVAGIGVSEKTTTGCNIWLTRTNTTNTIIDYIVTYF